ncbi:MAG: hypothetical protein K2W96_05975, partial [Gemmataceae bacterium]|nr:hypothetical protein [Gemmataceae bacterium]
NEESAKLRSVQAVLDADANQNGKAIGLRGNMACEKPRGFRLQAKVMGFDAVDLGSNSEEFWFWIKDSGLPGVCHCSHAALATGKVSIPFPFQPDMIMVAMGMADYEPVGTGKYEMKDNKAAGTLELTLDGKGADGGAVKRTVVFKRNKAARAGEPQVVGHILRDSAGKVVCEARVKAVHDEEGLKVPSTVELSWPEQKASMKLMLSGVKVNGIDRSFSADLFTRRPRRGVRSYDLATRRVDGLETTRASGR